MILDIHTHRPAPYPEGVVSLMDFETPLAEGQAYSIGIHPWDTAMPVSEESFVCLGELASRKEIVALGECGIDLLKGGPLYRQLQILKRQIELSEELKKPMVLHCVKAVDIILGLHRDLRPSQKWAIHGFRGKPETALQLTNRGIFLSFGEKFNPSSVMTIPGGMMLAETDESVLTIDEIIGSLSEAANRDVTAEIESNTAAFLGL